MARSGSRANTRQRTLENEDDTSTLTASPKLIVGQSCEAIFLSDSISFMMKFFYLTILRFDGLQIPGLNGFRGRLPHC